MNAATVTQPTLNEIWTPHELIVLRDLVEADCLILDKYLVRKLIRTLSFHAGASDHWMHAYHREIGVKPLRAASAKRTLRGATVQGRC